MSRVVHFEVHADDPERAIAFYTGALGWTFTQWGEHEYWMIITGPDDKPGINGGLVRRRAPIDGTSVISFVCSLDVESLDATVDAVLAHGGTLAVPKVPVPGVGWLAYVKDTEGNIFGMMEEDASAA